MKMGQYLLDHMRIFDIGDDSVRATAGWAGLEVDTQCALQVMRPDDAQSRFVSEEGS